MADQIMEGSIGAVKYHDRGDGTLAEVVSNDPMTKLAGEDLTVDVIKVEERFNYAYISTAATTVIKSGSGYINNIVVNGGVAGTIIIYDNTAGSGQIIASFDPTASLFAYTFDAIFATGLTIVTSAATKLTVSYR